MVPVRRFLELLNERGWRAALKSSKIFLLNKIVNNTIDPIYKKIFELRHGTGVHVMEEDWDNLILLDACRYDYFKQHTSFEGNLTRKVSRGYNSWEFMQENFVGKEFHDTVYVTANPYSERLAQDIFYTVETVLDRWVPDKGTVLPEDVTEVAIMSQEKYPNKRLIVHYMQPHLPHLGEIAQRYDEEFEISGWDQTHGNDEMEKRKDGVVTWWLYRQGHITEKELSKSYLETLGIVESHVQELVDELVGKTVISADHGENLGETRYGITHVGHQRNTKECRFIPWMELPHNERKTIIEESPIGFDYLEEKYVQEKLEDLGYL